MTIPAHELHLMADDPDLSTPRREAAQWALERIRELEAALIATCQRESATQLRHEARIRAMEAALVRARADALEEAATVAQSADTPIFKDEWTSGQDAAAISSMQSIAAAIRALNGQTDGWRMCVNCGVQVPPTHDRGQPGPGCPSPDACTFDLTQAEVALVKARADALEEAARVAEITTAAPAQYNAKDHWRAEIGREAAAAIRAMKGQTDG